MTMEMDDGDGWMMELGYEGGCGDDVKNCVYIYMENLCDGDVKSCTCMWIKV